LQELILHHAVARIRLALRFVMAYWRAGLDRTLMYVGRVRA